MKNESFGALTVLFADGRYRCCRCACGTEKRVRIDHLRSGVTVSCGCVGRQNAAIAKTKHGMSETRVFKIWLGMLDRCRNERHPHYHGKGIKVCPEWEGSFNAFYSHMGEPPSTKHSIDRMDVHGNYEPGNCRWATAVEQARNTTRNTVLAFDGKVATISEWSQCTGIKASTICVRLYNLGWSVERALTQGTQPRTGKKPWLAAGMSRSAWYRAARIAP